MSRNAFVLFDVGGCSPSHPKLGGVESVAPKPGGGVVCRARKWGGTHLRPKAAQIWAPPPLGMFLAASLKRKFHIFHIPILQYSPCLPYEEVTTFIVDFFVFSKKQLGPPI